MTAIDGGLSRFSSRHLCERHIGERGLRKRVAFAGETKIGGVAVNDVQISMKGSSAGLLARDAPEVVRDKLNSAVYAALWEDSIACSLDWGASVDLRVQRRMGA